MLDSINSLSNRTKLGILALLILGLIVLVYATLNRQNLFGRAAAPDKLEAEGGVLSASGANKLSDSQASGGEYVLFANQAPSPTPAFRPFTFTAAGDYGYPEATNTLQQISQGSEFTLALGDLSYGNITPESAWCNYVKGFIGNNYPFQLIVGNHDDGAVVGQGYIDNFAACLPNKMSNITDTYGRRYYFDYPATNPIARFILIDPDIDYVAGTTSYALGTPNYTWTQSA